MAEKSKIERLMDEADATIAKLHDLMGQMRAAIAGANPVGEVIAFWMERWQRRYRSKYELSPADAKQIKMHVARLSAEDLKKRLGRYIADGDPFLMRNKHPLSLFWNRVNTYNGASSVSESEIPDEPTAPVGCMHRPPCRSDVEHTNRRLSEMRA